jgi:hypothetical protein
VKFCVQLFRLNRLSTEPEPRLKTSEPKPPEPRLAWAMPMDNINNEDNVNVYEVNEKI